MRHLFPLVAAALFLASARPSPADRVVLKDGRVFEGVVVDQTEREVKIDLQRNGAKLTFPMDQVERVERTAGSPEQLYEGRLVVTDRGNADSLAALADWCAKNGLEAKAAAHYIEALGIQGDHPRARGRLSEMGWKEIEGRWRSPEEVKALENPPKDPPKVEVPRGPTSEDVARSQGKCVLQAWGGTLPGVAVWASPDGLLWVCGAAARAAQDTTVDWEGKKLAGKVLARDRLRELAVWKADGVFVTAAKPSFATLPEMDPLVALAPGGIVANVFARGWENRAPEVWRIRLEGPDGGAAIFDLSGKLVGLSSDGRGAVGALDLARLLLVKAPAPEGAQNAAGSYWRACDTPDGPALEMIRAGAKLENFDPGLGADEMNRAEALARDLARLGRKLGGSVEDHVAAFRLARHCARAGRVPFGVAAAEIIKSQATDVLKLLPKLSQSQAMRLRAAVDGLGPDPAGLEASATGEVARLEAVVFPAKDIRSIDDMRMAGFPILGPAGLESLELGATAMFDAKHAAEDFARKVRGACSRPAESRRDDLLALPAGPGQFSSFPDFRARAFGAMTAQTALRIALRLREARAESGSYPAAVPPGLEDPATGKPFDYKPGPRGFTLVAPGGETFTLEE